MFSFTDGPEAHNKPLRVYITPSEISTWDNASDEGLDNWMCHRHSKMCNQAFFDGHVVTRKLPLPIAKGSDIFGGKKYLKY